GLAVLGERLATLQLMGVGLLLLGILAVTLAQATGRATVPALLTGVAIAAYTTVDRVGVRLTEPWMYGWLLFTLMAIELPVSLWVAGRLGFYRPPDPYSGPTWRQAVIIGVFFLAGYVLVLVALSFAPLAIVAPVRETAVVAVAVWGVWRLRERKRSEMTLSGALATLVGVALLATWSLQTGREAGGKVGLSPLAGRCSPRSDLLERTRAFATSFREEELGGCRLGPSRSWSPTVASASSQPRMGRSTSSTAPAWTRA